MKKIVRKLNWETVRSYCIINDLYTNGCNEDYTKLYNYISDRDNYITDDDLIIIACDIYNHSYIKNNDLEIIDIISGLNRNSFYEVI